MPADLLRLSREIKGIAETGLRFGEGDFDRERYQRLHAIASELLQAQLPDFRWPVETGYPTPKVDTRACVLHQGKVLLVKERSVGLWTLPGGWADLDATPAENCAREVLEESGYEVRVRKLLACWDKQRQGHPMQVEYVYKLVFAAELLGGEPVTSHEISEVGWFDPAELPPMCPDRGAPHYVELALRHQREPGLPTEFD